MNRESAKKYLIDAVQLLKKELPSLGEDIGERTIMCRLAHHLANKVEKLCSSLHVDCEYNRYEDDPKMLPLSPMVDDVFAGHGGSRRFFPDIVVHKRADDGNNILACEIKKSNARHHNLDHCRLKKLTHPNGRFRYLIGVFLEIDQKGRCVTATYFENGEKYGKPEKI